MYITQSEVKTAKGSRYMRQLCKHWHHRFVVSYDAQQGEIAFSDTQHIYLQADDQALRVQIHCRHSADLASLENVVAEHLKRFAFQENLEFSWTQSVSEETQAGSQV